MVGKVLRALIYIGFLALLFYIVIWFLGQIGIVLPYMVVRIIGAICVLFVLLILWNLFGGSVGSFDWWGNKNNQGQGGPQP